MATTRHNPALGMKPELLVDAISPRAAGRCHPTAAHDFGDRAAPLPLRGRQNLAPRRPHWGEQQRSLRGEGCVPTADGSAAEDCAARIRLRAGNVASPALKTSADPLRAVHRNLCTVCKRKGASNFGARIAGKGLSEGGKAADNRPELLSHERYQSSRTCPQNVSRVHNPGYSFPTAKATAPLGNR